MNKKQSGIHDWDRSAKRCNEIGHVVEMCIEGSLYDPNYEINKEFESRQFDTLFIILVSTVETTLANIEPGMNSHD